MCIEWSLMIDIDFFVRRLPARQSVESTGA